MEKTRVPKGEEYYFINNLFEVMSDYENKTVVDDIRFDTNNYFHTQEEAESMVRKLRSVLKGADVIEMPSEEEIEERRNFWDRTPTDARTGFGDCLQWLKSKIVK